jgi:hypothetical protein
VTWGHPVDIAYRPPGRVLRAFMASNADVRGIMGPFGSGKSTACCMEILRRWTLQPPGHDGVRRTRVVVVRNTYRELETTTISTWHQWVPESVGHFVWGPPPVHELRFGDFYLEVVFLALDRPADIARLLSFEATHAWLNEARELPKAVLDGVTGRVGRYPSAALGGLGWYGVWMDSNPPDDDHWWHELAQKNTPRGYAFFAQPSGLSEEAENLDWLTQTDATLLLPEGHPERRARGRQYYERLLSGKSEAWVRVYVHGRYGFVQDGRPVYPEWQEGLHERAFEWDASQPGYLGFDFGLTPACTVGQRSAAGQMRVHSEVVTEDMGVVRFAAEVKRHLAEHYPRDQEWVAITGDPAGNARQAGDRDERTVFQLLAAEGIAAQPAHSNDFDLRREAVAESLLKLTRDGPALIVHPQCRVLCKAMAGRYRYRRLEVVGQERFRDVPDKNAWSHVAEALQYLMLGAGAGKALVRKQGSGAARPAKAAGSEF